MCIVVDKAVIIGWAESHSLLPGPQVREPINWVNRDLRRREGKIWLGAMNQFKEDRWKMCNNIKLNGIDRGYHMETSIGVKSRFNQ